MGDGYPIRRFVLAPLLVIALAPPPTRGDGAVRLTDLDPDAGDGVESLDAAVVGGALYFVGRGVAGRTILRYDGAAPPSAVAGAEAAAPRELIAWNERLYFQGGPSSDRELWMYDPAGPTIGEALDVRAGGNGLPQRFAVAGDELCFGAFTDTVGFELVCWDGATPAQIFDLAAGTDSSFPEQLTAWAGGLGFTVSFGGAARLYTYDGESLPVEVEAGPGEPFSGPGAYAAVGQDLLFEALDGGGVARLFRFDGSNPPQRDSTTLTPYGYPAPFRGRAIVDGVDPDLGLGSPELLRRLPSGYTRLSPGVTIVGGAGHVTAAGGLYFIAYPSEQSDDADLYRYCGAGSVAPASAAFAGVDVTLTDDRVAVFNGRAFVAASDPTYGSELWAVTPAHLFCDDFESGDLAAWP